LLPAVEQSLMLLLPAKAAAQCWAVQGNEVFNERQLQETHLVGAIL
jgi:hypothetical protein